MIRQLDNHSSYHEFHLGYIFEVDIHIPNEIHDKMNDYPIAESLKVKEEMYSTYQKELSKDLVISVDVVNKLVPNLKDKTKYVTHYRNLKKYVDLGCVITKFHRGIQFKQEPWLKEYIDFNTSQRSIAKNDFEKDFFKLMNNSV